MGNRILLVKSGQVGNSKNNNKNKKSFNSNKLTIFFNFSHARYLTEHLTYTVSLNSWDDPTDGHDHCCHFQDGQKKKRF